MHRALALGYEGVAQLARAVAAIVPRSEHKLLETFAARRGVRARFASFHRQPDRPLLWMHAPSVGEGLQARPILELARRSAPDLQLAYTYFSPSAKALADALDVDFRDVLPFDAAGDMCAALAALDPTALVFSKVDVWPTLARQAARRGTRLGLVSATLAAASSRRTGVAAALLRDAYARLDGVGAISPADADRLVALGVPPHRVRVTGDTRYDQVWARARAVDRNAGFVGAIRGTRLTVVAGSTWPSDEAQLFPAWARLAARHPDVRLIVAPHEPTGVHLAPIEAWAAGARLRAARLSDPSAMAADVVIVDRVGVLAELYAVADLAFVGGAFHRAGLHSVIEPAAFAAPVLFGPGHQGSRDARLLLDAGAAIEVEDARALEQSLERWISSSDDRMAAGAAARDVVRGGLGAAARTWALVQELLR